MFQTLHEISKNLIFVFVWKYVWKYVNINVSDITWKKKKKKKAASLKNDPIWDFPGGAVVKNPPANAGDMGLSPGLGRSHMPQSN